MIEEPDTETPMATERAATVLGYAGLLPLYAAAFAVALSPTLMPVQWALNAHLGGLYYAAILLSFLAGGRWFLGVQRQDEGSLAWAAIPALLGWVAIWPSGFLGLAIGAAWRYVILLLAFVLVMIWDLRAVNAGHVPPWYGRLRVRLTFLTVVAFLVLFVRLYIWGYR